MGLDDWNIEKLVDDTARRIAEGMVEVLYNSIPLPLSLKSLNSVKNAKPKNLVAPANAGNKAAVKNQATKAQQKNAKK
ncbi:hypothetical protein CRE_07657 [Caenorhabditis remanei]|uniref:Uncharacterized protein n=1 Tax=Caenorhabditis remanei TaxID=31234 RepID=E3MP46_CAERE|nr:hypothetical protein CRE_07657 [Caenorhabditis remanei]